MNTAFKDNFKIEIDRDLCIGAASCAIIAPNTFILDDQGKVDILEGELDDIATIIAAADSCPVRAITITEQALKDEQAYHQSQNITQDDSQPIILIQDQSSSNSTAQTNKLDLAAFPALTDALKTVLDPELGINVVDLGLVYRIDQQDSTAIIDLTLTTPGCPLIAEFTQSAKDALLQVAGITDAIINLTFTPLWSPSKMSQEAKEELGLFI